MGASLRETGSREPNPQAVSALTGFDPARGDYLRCPAPPLLGGGLKPTKWLESMAAADDKKKAHARAREARAIADWLKRIARWLEAESYEIPAAIEAKARGESPHNQSNPKVGA